MRKLLMATAVSVMAMGAVQAAPIVGSLSINGVSSYDATTLDFIGNGNVGAGTASGSYSPTFSPGCVACAVMTDFVYNALGAHAPVTVYAATIAAVTASFTLNNIASFTNAGGFLNIAASGFANLTGFDQTPGTISISSQGPSNVSVTFSATTRLFHS